MEKRDGKANRPFCSRVMKERQVVMKERAIPGPRNCCPRGPRILYYSMGLAIWIEKDKRYRTSDSLRDSENAVEMCNSRDMCENSFSHMSSRHLSSRSSLHIIADRQ